MIGLATRGLGAGASFGLAWLIAQIYGSAVFGLYQIGFTTVTLLSLVVILGQDIMIVRQSAPLIQQQREREAGAVLRSALHFVARSGLLAAAGLAAVAMPFARYALAIPDAAIFIIAFAPFLIFNPALRIQNAFLRCLGKTATSQSLEGIFYTSFAALCLGALWLMSAVPQGWVLPLLLIAGQVITVAIGGFILSRLTRAWPNATSPAAVDLRTGARIATAPILNQAFSWLLLVLVAGAIDESAAGVFRVAVLICLLMQLVVNAFGTMVGPYLARAASEQDHAKLRRTVLVAGGIGFVITVPVALAAWLVPEFLLGLFGPEFVAGALALQLLAAGELVNVMAGPVGIALIMQNRERIVIRNMAISVVAGLGLAAATLPTLGVAAAGLGLLVASGLRNALNLGHFWLPLRAA